MDRSVHGCHDSLAAAQRAAREHLDSLVAGPLYTDNRLAEDVAHARFRIRVLQAMNGIDVAELRNLSHSCIACNCSAETAAHNDCATTLATALINDAKDRLKKMEVITARIKDRSDTVQKLEQHLKTYDNIRKSLDIVLPGDGTKYSYSVDLDKGVSLVIQTPDRCACKGDAGPSGPNLIDFNPLLDNTASVINPASSSSSTLVSPVSGLPVYSPLTTTSSPPSSPSSPPYFEANSNPVPETTATDVILSGPRAQTEPQPQPNSPIFQIRDEEDRHLASLPSYFRARGVFNPNSNFNPNPNGTPLFFRYGIQYNPPVSPSSSSNTTNEDDDDDKTAHSHMVVFANLHPSTTSHDILSRVRGGPVLRAVGACENAALVTFVHAADASAYVSYIHARTLSIRGRQVAVSLAPTASYPPRAELLLDIARHGVTRCLAFPRYDAAVSAFVAQRRAWGFVEATLVVSADGLRDCAGPSVEAGEAAEWDVAVEGEGEGEGGWVGMEVPVAVDENRLVNAAMGRGALVLVSFRDVAFAQTALESLRRWFPRCGVRYAPDRCAGPLSELEGTG
ncbi:hypothetical protein F5X97DRAFT_342427 [Nemania serpens]|nr:hypothetical protein F5X97DRAFT_342427 [Nemania serpens]